MDRRSHGCLLQFCTVFVAITVLVVPDCSAAPPTDADSSHTEPALLVVSYDAFRPDYLKRGVTPYMNKFRKEGASTDFLNNVFPTKTFVNHYTLATGFYPKAHGVLANSLYDTTLGKPMGYSYELFHYNETIWPIWTVNEKAGKHSGCMMWPGSNFAYDGINCTFTVAFDESVPMKARVDTAINWFTHKKTPANLVMLYIEEPDMHGHAYSPDSNETTTLVAELDDLTKYIQDKLVENKLDRHVNVIHLSDHGLSTVIPPNFINLTDFVRSDAVNFYGSSPVLQIVPNDSNMLDEIHANLTRGARQNGHFKVYTPVDLPKRWRAANAQRMGPLLALADIDYAFQDMYEAAEFYKQHDNVILTPTTKYGVHGYDNDEESMHAFFMAKGPLIARGKHLKPFNLVDLCNLFCRILKIECRPNEGADRTDIWDQMLRVPTTTPIRPTHPTRKLVMTLLAAVGVMVVILCAIGALMFWRRRHADEPNKPVRLQLTDDLEGELLLQSDEEADV